MSFLFGDEMRAQISFEYLLIAAISLCLISISLLSLISIRNYAMQSLELIKFSSTVSLLDNTINEVCVMGNGNSRYIYIEDEIDIESVKSDLWVVRFSNNNFSIVKTSFCYVEGKTKGKTQIKNNLGTVTLQQVTTP
jgi:hypothetical protein